MASAASAVAVTVLFAVGANLSSVGSARAAAGYVSLGTTGNDDVHAGSTVAHSGPGVINATVGLSPGTAVTGFPPSDVDGTVHGAHAAARQGKAGSRTAYNVPASGATTQVVRVPSAFFGIHDGSLQSYGRVSFGSIRLWDVGVTWREIETSPGVYDWSRLDSQVAAAQAHGVQVTLVLAMTPSFYAAAPTLPPADLSHYADFVRAVMTRYRAFNGGRGIAAYQVWNEGNLSTFWTGTPGQLAQLTKVVHDVRDAVDPGATVVAPSFAMRMTYQADGFAAYQSQQVDGVPVWHYVDANALSLYPMESYGSRPGGPEDALALLAEARRRLAHNGVPADLPVWATEINYGLPSGGAPGQLVATPISERRQVANVLRTYVLGAARGLSRLFWYRYDWGTVGNGGTLGNTLLATPNAYDQTTPAGLALGTAQAWLRGRLVGTDGRPPCSQSSRGTYSCIVRYPGGIRRIYWNPTHSLRVPLPAGATYRQTGLGNRRTVSRRATSVQVGYQPVMVDSPS